MFELICDTKQMQAVVALEGNRKENGVLLRFLWRLHCLLG